MVEIELQGRQWVAKLFCTQCRTTRIEQFHQRMKPCSTVESTIKTTARTLGWKVGNKSAICGACRRDK